MLGNPRKRLPAHVVDWYDAFRFETRGLVGRMFQQRGRRVPSKDYLNIGCGIIPERVPEAFYNTDHFLFGSEPWVDDCLDIRFPLPYADEEWKGLFAHHVLEHISYPHACSLLKECHRVLKPGGVLRVVVPDAEKAAKLYASSDPEDRRYLMDSFYPGKHDTPMEVLNDIFRSRKVQQSHHFGWDFETLQLRMREVGFGEVKRMQAGQSLDPVLECDHMPWAAFSLYVDARK